jgi:ferredoxin-NADP reductase
LGAGGVGIAGVSSMLRTLADRQDGRPVMLVYANRVWHGVAFRDGRAFRDGARAKEYSVA